MAGDLLDDAGIGLVLQPGEHHLDHREAAAAGQTAAFVSVEAHLGLDLGELFLKALEVLPMDRGAVAVEQARRRQRLAAGFHAGKLGAEAPLPAQPVDQTLVRRDLARVEGGENEDRIVARLVVEAALDGHFGAARGGDRLAVDGQNAPLDDRAPAEPIGQEQGLRGQGQAEVRELRQDHEGRPQRSR